MQPTFSRLLHSLSEKYADEVLIYDTSESRSLAYADCFSLTEIWNGKAYEEFRNNMISGNYQNAICGPCMDLYYTEKKSIRSILLFLLKQVYIRLWKWDGDTCFIKCQFSFFIYMEINFPIVLRSHMWTHGKVYGAITKI